MNTNGCIRINVPKVVHETIDGETVILNLDNGNYYSLDGIGAHIWNYIDKGATAHDIIERLHCDYENGRESIKSEVHKFLSELMQENLTVPAEPHSSEVFKTFENHVEAPRKKQKTSFIPPVLNKYTDMQDLLLLDPIHEVDDELGWPTRNSE